MPESAASASDDYDARFQQALEWIRLLRAEAFNQATEARLANHLFVLAAEQGQLTLAQKRAFVCEQLAIQRSDAASFAHLAGYTDFRPKSLVGAKAPAPKQQSTSKFDNLFQFLLGGELYAAQLLLDHAKYLGLDGEEAVANAQPHNHPLAQAYPAYWTRIALNQDRAAGAAACAVNFPAWGSMCGRLVKAYQGQDATVSDQDLAFLQFFATPIDNLDEMAAHVMAQETALDYEEIAQHVRLLQEYEVLFWDACYSAKNIDGNE